MSSLDGNARRAIDIHKGDEVDEAALKDLPPSIAIEDASVGHDVAVSASYVRSSAAGVVASSVDLSSAWWAFAIS